jgi:hypothetical protein
MICPAHDGALSQNVEPKIEKKSAPLPQGAWQDYIVRYNDK